MPSSFEENTEVITLDGKKIGKVKKIENDDGHFIVYKKGLLTDEEFRVPVSAILTRGNISANGNRIRLNMSEKTLKHGYQFAQAGPNSQFMHGIKESEPKVKLEKQVIHFEPVEAVEEPNKTGISSPPVSKQHQAVLKQGEESSTLYSCDMCPAKFKKAEELQKHRSESHKAAFNI
jgi:hypothetical protein